MVTPPVRSIAVEVTTRCTQRCAYCYNHDRHATRAGRYDLRLSLLARLLDEVAGTELNEITLTGGEPFAHARIDAIIDAINAAGRPVFVISNGSLTDRARAHRLSTQDVRAVQTTLAGPDADSHDALCGAGSYAGAVAAVEHLGAAGVGRAGSYLCTATNFDRAAEVFERFADLGVTRVAFNRFNPAGDARAAIDALMPTRSEVLAALAQADAVAADRDLTISCTMPIPSCVLDAEDYPHVGFGSCSAGTEYGQPAIGPDGSVRLCTMQLRAVGSLHEDPLDVILARAVAEERWCEQIPDFCAACPVSETCLGGCGAAAEWAFGTPRELDPFVAQHVMADYEERLRALRA